MSHLFVFVNYFQNVEIIQKVVHKMTRNETSKEECIAGCLQRGMSWKDIKKNLRVSGNRITRVSEAIKTRSPIPTPLPMGRPKKISPQIINFVDLSTLDNPIETSSDLALQIAEKLGVDISKSTINNIRHMLRFSYKQPRKVQELSEIQISKRISFAKTQLEGPYDWATQAVISDESRFALRDDSRRIWVKNGVYNSKTFRGIEKFNKSIMVWGVVGYGWRSPLLVIKGNLNAKKYVAMLTENSVIETWIHILERDHTFFNKTERQATEPN